MGEIKQEISINRNPITRAIGPDANAEIPSYTEREGGWPKLFSAPLVIIHPISVYNFRFIWRDVNENEIGWSVGLVWKKGNLNPMYTLKKFKLSYDFSQSREKW